jgi:putative aminopeptidase FrvX
MALSGGGIITALISPPLRYMHTPVELVHIDDVENTILLMLETLRNIDPDDLREERKIPFLTEYEKARMRV